MAKSNQDNRYLTMSIGDAAFSRWSDELYQNAPPDCLNVSVVSLRVAVTFMRRMLIAANLVIPLDLIPRKQIFPLQVGLQVKISFSILLARADRIRDDSTIACHDFFAT